MRTENTQYRSVDDNPESAGEHVGKIAEDGHVQIPNSCAFHNASLLIMVPMSLRACITASEADRPCVLPAAAVKLPNVAFLPGPLNAVRSPDFVPNPPLRAETRLLPPIVSRQTSLVIKVVPLWAVYLKIVDCRGVRAPDLGWVRRESLRLGFVFDNAAVWVGGSAGAAAILAMQPLWTRNAANVSMATILNKLDIRTAVGERGRTYCLYPECHSGY